MYQAQGPLDSHAVYGCVNVDLDSVFEVNCASTSAKSTAKQVSCVSSANIMAYWVPVISFFFARVVH